MDNQKNPQPSVWERAEQSFQSILSASGIVRYLSPDQKEVDIAVISNGPGIEIWPFQQYFSSRGVHPRFVGVFLRPEDKEVTQKVLDGSVVDMTYRIGDLVYQNMLPERDYDIIVLRHFEAENEPNMWPMTLRKCFAQLKIGGIFFITTNSSNASDFIKQLIPGRVSIEQELVYPKQAQVAPYLAEDTIIIAKK